MAAQCAPAAMGTFIKLIVWLHVLLRDRPLRPQDCHRCHRGQRAFGRQSEKRPTEGKTMWGKQSRRALFAAIGALPALAFQSISSANHNASTSTLTAQEERQLAAGWYGIGINDG